MAEQLAAVRAIGESLAHTVGVDQLLAQVVVQVTRLMRAARTTLFIHDPEANEIWSKIAEGIEVREIRLRVGQGIAGWVAIHRKPAIVVDAYADERFNPAVDKATGFRTRSVAAAPLLDPEGKLLGVVQVLNRRGGPFNEQDMGLLTAIAAQIAFVLENARLSEELLKRNHELDLLYALEQEASASHEVRGLLTSALGLVCDQLNARAAAVLLRPARGAPVIYRLEGKRELSVAAVTADEPLALVADYGASMPEHSILRVPLVWDRRIIGAFEVSQPEPRGNGRAGFEDDDIKTMTVVAAQLSRVITNADERLQRNTNERLAAVGQMLASVAHDLRTPMTVVSGYAQLMGEEEDDPSQRTYRCNRILTQIDEMMAMIGDLLAFARGDSRLRAGDVKLESLAADLQETLRHACDPRGIKLAIERKPGVAVVDQGRVKRILHNLAKNAIDVMRRGDGLFIDLQTSDEGLHLTVRDQGPGMNEATRARIFEPFFTDKAGGTGLGLAIVKRFVEDHSGTIAVKSAPGQGTTVEVLLPHAARSENDTAMGAT
ncbi:MAG: GAF domain-containing protein [Myxococcota bacterium]